MCWFLLMWEFTVCVVMVSRVRLAIMSELNTIRGDTTDPAPVPDSVCLKSQGNLSVSLIWLEFPVFILYFQVLQVLCSLNLHISHIVKGGARVGKELFRKPWWYHRWKGMYPNSKIEKASTAAEARGSTLVHDSRTQHEWGLIRKEPLSGSWDDQKVLAMNQGTPKGLESVVLIFESA